MKEIHFSLRVDSSYMDTHVYPIMGKKSVVQDHCYFGVCTSGDAPNPRPGPSEILQIAFASVNFLSYFLVYCLQVVPIFFILFLTNYFCKNVDNLEKDCSMEFSYLVR